MMSFKVGDKVSPIPQNATGLLSIVGRWLQDGEPVDLTELIQGDFLEYVLRGAQHLLSSTEVGLLNPPALRDLYTQFDLLLIPPFPSLHQVFYDITSACAAGGGDISSIHISILDSTTQYAAAYRIYWDTYKSERGRDMYESEMVPSLSNTNFEPINEPMATILLDRALDRATIRVTFSNRCKDPDGYAKFPLRVGPFHEFRLEGEFQPYQRQTRGHGFYATLRLYSVVEKKAKQDIKAAVWDQQYHHPGYVVGSDGYIRC